MILNKESLIQLLKEYGCDFQQSPNTITYHSYRFITFSHWFYDKFDFRIHTVITKARYSDDGLKCKFTDTSPEFILSHLEKFKMWIDRLALNEKKEKLSKMVEQINEDFV